MVPKGRPSRRRANALPSPAVPPDYDATTPKFCFASIQSSCDVAGLPTEQQAALAMTLQELARFTWKELILGRKHSHGLEHIPSEAIRKLIPDRFRDQSKFTVFRYTPDNRPMLGVRVNDVFQILWVEREFGDVYKH